MLEDSIVIVGVMKNLVSEGVLLKTGVAVVAV